MRRSKLAVHDADAIMKTVVNPFAADKDDEFLAVRAAPDEIASGIPAIAGLVVAEGARVFDHRAVHIAVGANRNGAESSDDKRGAGVMIIHAVEFRHAARVACRPFVGCGMKCGEKGQRREHGAHGGAF